MSLVDTDIENLDDEKEVVFTTPFPKNKLLITARVTTSEEVHRRTKCLDDKREALFTTPFSKIIINN